MRPSLRLLWDGISHPRWTFGTFLRTLAKYGMPHFENNYATRGPPILSPSVVRDWSDGRWGRTLALGAGGLFCGFLWEFWNFWAGTKWVYHPPFLGSWEHYRYFEMPLPGLLGFIAFGIETWTMWQTTLLLLSPFVEGERRTAADADVHSYACL